MERSEDEDVGPAPVLRFCSMTVPVDSGLVRGDLDAQRSTEEEEEYDPYYEPIMQLPLVDTKSLEEDEEVLWEARARLYRFSDEDSEGEEMGKWKERGTGQVKLLKHKQKGCVRLLMRREQTLKLCANHYIQPEITLHQHAQSDRTWLWRAPADFAENVPRPELLAIRFKNTETAMTFREHFNAAKALMLQYQSDQKKQLEQAAKSDVGSSDDDGENLDKEMARVTLEESGEAQHQ